MKNNNLILNKNELLEYRKKYKNTMLLYSEQYEVRFRKQTVDGYCVNRAVIYYSSSKNSHSAVKEKWLIEYPNSELISVVYI